MTARTNLQASLRQFDRIGSIFAGWSNQLFREQNAAIAAAEESERLAREAMTAA